MEQHAQVAHIAPLVHIFEVLRRHEQHAAGLQAHEHVVPGQVAHHDGEAVILHADVERTCGVWRVFCRAEQGGASAGGEHGHELPGAAEVIGNHGNVAALVYFGVAGRNDNHRVCSEVLQCFLAGGEESPRVILWQHEEGSHQVTATGAYLVAYGFGRNNVAAQEAEGAERKEKDNQHAGQGA